jgi:hypothetical protein
MARKAAQAARDRCESRGVGFAVMHNAAMNGKLVREPMRGGNSFCSWAVRGEAGCAATAAANTIDRGLRLLSRVA